MKYYITLEQNFVDVRVFNQTASNTGTVVPKNFYAQPEPFFLGNLLHVPLVMGLNQGGGVLGFVKAKVANTLSLGDNQIRIILGAEDLKQAGVRLSAQSLKMLKTLRANNKAFEQDYNWSSRGFKCKAEEAVKCLAFKYLEFADDRAFLDHLTAQEYSLHARVVDKRNQMTAVYAEVFQYFQTSEKSHWAQRNLGNRLSYGIVRTMQPVDENCTIKWRKPSKNSKWPYTLDHHWFSCQESPVAMAHHTMAALMSKDGGRNRDQLMLNLPIFQNIRSLETCRKLLEHFFVNLKQTLQPHSSMFGHYCSMLNDFEWPTTRYSHKRLSPEMFPVKAALALGVLPTFDESGTFQKFVPVNGTLHANEKTIYIEMSSNFLSDRRPEQALLLLYSVGLISLEDLEKVLGPVSQNEESLKDSLDKIQLQMSRNVVCCLPLDAANQTVGKMLAKYGISQDSISSSSKDLAAIDPDDLETAINDTAEDCITI
jgi:hypothetical protein